MLGAGVVRYADASRRGAARPGERARRPFIVETGSERHLLFSNDSVQSSMRLDDPDALTCEYTRRMMAFLLFNPDPRHILMIGLGGGSLAKFCYRHLPSAAITAVEIDSDVIALRDEFCLPFDDHRFRVVHDDGARFVARVSDRFDAILIDAFDQSGVAPSLGTPEFYRNVSARLDPRGVLVMNLSGEASRYDAHLQGFHGAFGERTMLLPIASSGNELLFALGAEVSLQESTREERARELQRVLALDFPRYASLLANDARKVLERGKSIPS